MLFNIRSIHKVVTPSLFVWGAVIGMSPGALVSRRLAAVVLQKVFATGIIGVAIFIVSKTFV